MKRERNKIKGRCGTISDKKNQILKLLSQGVDLQSACKKTGIGRTTCWRWRKEDPVFDQAIEDLFAVRRESQLLSVQETEELLGPVVIKYRPQQQSIEHTQSETDESTEQLAVGLGYAIRRKEEPVDKIAKIEAINGSIKRQRIAELEAERRRKAQADFDWLRYGL